MPSLTQVRDAVKRRFPDASVVSDGASFIVKVRAPRGGLDAHERAYIQRMTMNAAPGPMRLDWARVVHENRGDVLHISLSPIGYMGRKSAPRARRNPAGVDVQAVRKDVKRLLGSAATVKRVTGRGAAYLEVRCAVKAHRWMGKTAVVDTLIPALRRHGVKDTYPEAEASEGRLPNTVDVYVWFSLPTA